VVTLLTPSTERGLAFGALGDVGRCLGDLGDRLALLL